MNTYTINVKNFGAMGDGTTDDTMALQKAIDTAAAQGGGTVYVPASTSAYPISSTLFVEANITLYLDNGAVIYLQDGSNCPMLSNKYRTSPDQLAITDHHISVIGGVWDGNGSRNERIAADGNLNAGFAFFGVRHLLIRDVTVNATVLYGIFICNWEDVKISNVDINQTNLNNQDGIHFQGPGNHAIVEDIYAYTFDDAVAFNCDDVPSGPYATVGDQSHIQIRNITFRKSLNGIRLLCAKHSLRKVTVSGLRGEVTDNVVALSNYQLGTGGQFQDILIEDVKVDASGAHCNFMNEYGGYITINDHVRNVTVRNVHRRDEDGRATVRVQSRADIQDLLIEDVITYGDGLHSEYGAIRLEAGSKVRNATVRHCKLYNNPELAGSRQLIDTAGSRVGMLLMDSCMIHQ
ncbi:glycosyl hydrolase family 28-related protein [Paenibacillus eucommiae]|uniref:Polygalacturonase n=1 Tax=Paenibacillus eucommiae TaxID=1355755 RepID=A0ABS4IT57_9BACL|nr:glycosyl hydrolase family 28-related protein [Paenibacillus eucommiae]MBP1990756.1 polygalacturonase [Paenibacillus eucommiae]